MLPYFRGSEVGYGDGHGPRWAEAQPGGAGHSTYDAAHLYVTEAKKERAMGSGPPQ